MPSAPPYSGEQVPGPSSPISESDYDDAPLDIPEDHLARLVQEGGVEFLNYLLTKAIPDVDFKNSNYSLPIPLVTGKGQPNPEGRWVWVMRVWVRVIKF